MTGRLRRTALMLALLPSAAGAQMVPGPLRVQAPGFAFDLPAGAVLSAERTERLGRSAIPTGPFSTDGIPVRQVEGEVVRRAWRIAGSEDLTTLDLLLPVRAAAAAAGYEIVLDCATADCGGFDFRYGVEILPEPAMHVNLGDFRSLSALRRTPGGEEALSLTVSRDASGGFVQLVTVAPAGPAAAAPAPAPPPADGRPDGATDLSAALSERGFAVLDGLRFASGGSDLAAGEIPVLATLAAWLDAHPGARLVLVGHTDSSGGAAANLAISRRRAEAVRQRLIAVHGVDPDRLRAEGAGALAPRASNLTPEGRAANRRVEAVLTAAP